MKWFKKVLDKIKLTKQVEKEWKEILRKALLHKTRGQHYLIPAKEIVGNFPREEALEYLRIRELVTAVVSFDLHVRIILTDDGVKEALKLVGGK